MRILHIASGDFFSTYGGGQVYVKNIVDEMLCQGMDIAVISTVGDEDRIATRNYNGAKLVEIGNATVGSRLKETISGLSPDIIHAHSRKAEICVIGQELNIPVVVTAHHGGILCPAGTRLRTDDSICHCAPSHKECLACSLRQIPGGLRVFYPLMRNFPEKAYLKLGNTLSRKRFMPFLTPVGCAAIHIRKKTEEWNAIAEKCSLMIAPCQEIADAMTLNGLPQEKLRTVPHGIPLPEHRPSYPSVDGKIRMFYVGRICYVKGIHTLLEAMSMVEDSRLELHLIGGAGNKYERRYIRHLQKKHKNDARIVWHGKIQPDEVYANVSDMHFSIAPAAYLEAFGLNIAESLAIGKPVLATRNGGAEQQITDGVNGWLVPTNNPAALADKIKEVLSEPEKLATMSANCSAMSIEEHARVLRDVYSSLL